MTPHRCPATATEPPTPVIECIELRHGLAAQISS
jgi:hypothetical protein